MIESSNNPYSFTDEAATVAGATEVRPKWITFIGVTALVLAILGLLVSVGGVAGQIFGRSVQQQIISAAKANPKNQQLQAQAEIQAAGMKVAEKYFVANLVIMLTSLPACLLLLVGSVLLLRRSPAACRWMLAACLATLVTDLGKAVVGGFAQRDNMRVMGEIMPNTIAADPNVPAERSEQLQQVMRTGMTIVGIVAFALTALWFLLKAAFYGCSISYLARPEVRGYFETPAGMTMP